MEENKQEVIELISEEQKKDLLKVLLKDVLDEKNQPVSYVKIDLLTKLKELYEQKVDFKVGDIIKWKDQLKNRKIPDYNEPIIIMEMLEEPFFDTKADVGSAYFNEKYDIKAGILQGDALLTFYFDSNRFELFTNGKES